MHYWTKLLSGEHCFFKTDPLSVAKQVGGTGRELPRGSVCEGRGGEVDCRRPSVATSEHTER